MADDLTALDLPLEISIPPSPRAFLVFVSGDGGWAALDRGVAEALGRDGIAVIGWSAIRYFWHAKTPRQLMADLDRVVNVLQRANKPIAVGGYSFGAEVVPVALASAPRPDRRAIQGVVSIAPARTASFEIDPLDWIRTASDTSYRVKQAFASVDIPALCVRPADDAESGCADIPPDDASVVMLPGSHHFNGRYEDVAAAIAHFIDRF